MHSFQHTLCISCRTGIADCAAFALHAIQGWWCKFVHSFQHTLCTSCRTGITGHADTLCISYTTGSADRAQLAMYSLRVIQKWCCTSCRLCFAHHTGPVVQVVHNLQHMPCTSYRTGIAGHAAYDAMHVLQEWCYRLSAICSLSFAPEGQ